MRVDGGRRRRKGKERETKDLENNGRMIFGMAKLEDEGEGFNGDGSWMRKRKEKGKRKGDKGFGNV